MTAIKVVHGDITQQDVDALVNAANVDLRHGGGVAAAIARAGGPAIQEESDRWVQEHGPLSPGVAATTTGGEMPARWVVHVAGPIYSDGQDNEALLRQAVRAALDAAVEAGARSAALPAISAGIYGYPLEEATAIIAAEADSWSAEQPGLTDIRLVAWGAEAAAAFEAAVARL